VEGRVLRDIYGDEPHEVRGGGEEGERRRRRREKRLKKRSNERERERKEKLTFSSFKKNSLPQLHLFQPPTTPGGPSS
jgi:hypothetical protein